MDAVTVAPLVSVSFRYSTITPYRYLTVLSINNCIVLLGVEMYDFSQRPKRNSGPQWPAVTTFIRVKQTRVDAMLPIAMLELSTSF